MRFEQVGLAPDTVDYTAGWHLQRRVHAAVAGALQEDTVLLLEHTAVYTAGKRTQDHERPQDSTPVIDVDRGGKITWHGPGQLVGYPIVRLPSPVDVVAHVRRLEDMLMGVCADFGVAATQVDGRSGVWVSGAGGERDRKLGAIGIRVSQDVTMHGFALNCDCDLGWADAIVPCGIADAGVTSLTREAGSRINVRDVLPRVEHHLRRVLQRVPDRFDRGATTAGAPA